MTPLVTLVFHIHFIASYFGFVYHFEFHSFLIISPFLQTLEDLRIERNRHFEFCGAGITMNGLFHAALYGIVTSILLKFAQFFCQFREILVRNCLLIKV